MSSTVLPGNLQREPWLFVGPGLERYASDDECRKRRLEGVGDLRKYHRGVGRCQTGREGDRATGRVGSNSGTERIAPSDGGDVILICNDAGHDKSDGRDRQGLDSLIDH